MEPVEEDRGRDGEKEEEEEEGFEDAVQTLAQDVKTDEQNAEPEADQAKTEPLNVDNTDGDTFNDTEVDDKGDAGKEEDVAGLPEDDITMATTGNEDTDDALKVVKEPQLELDQEFAKMKVSDEQEENGEGEQGGENGISEDAESDAVAISNDTVRSVGDGVEDDHLDESESAEGDVANGDHELQIGGSSDAPVVAMETDAEVDDGSKDVETDVNESFVTARGDISDVSPGGDGSLYASLSTVSIQSGDLDSTLECDKTLDLTESPESGTSDANDSGKVVGGGGDAPLSPPRCDSGIMEEGERADEIQVSKEEMKSNLPEGSKEGSMEVVPEESIVNGN